MCFTDRSTAGVLGLKLLMCYILIDAILNGFQQICFGKGMHVSTCGSTKKRVYSSVTVSFSVVMQMILGNMEKPLPKTKLSVLTTQ